MRFIVQYLFQCMKNSAELAESDSVLDACLDDSFLYYDGENLRLYRITVAEVAFAQ